MVITQLRLVNFKNHKDLTIDFKNITRILGRNGTGKSSVGEAITWLLYGVDTFGSKTDPSPATYEFEQLEAHLLLAVDDKQILLGKVLPAGKAAKFYVNEVPKKAKEYESFVKELFDKQLFLSLFSPTYFFTQHWEEQREQLLRYVLPPSNKEVLALLPEPQAMKLTELVKKKRLDDLEAQHKENRRKQEKALIAAKSRTKTLEEQFQAVPNNNDIDITVLTEKLCEINEKINKHTHETLAARENNNKIERLKTQIRAAFEAANKVRGDYTQLKEAEIKDTCNTCGQMLTNEAIEHTKQLHQKQLDEIKYKYQTMLDQYNRMRQEIKELQEVEIDDISGLYQQRIEIESKLKAIKSQNQQALAIEEAKQNECDIHTSFTESVFILDAIKAFKAKEAELMAEKVGKLFETLTLKLFIENKSDGEQKPHFEVEMDGKPYRKLSTAEKILAGLELISVLSQQRGVIVPVFVDNAESIISYKSPAGQLIECHVADKPFTVLKVEV